MRFSLTHLIAEIFMKDTPITNESIRIIGNVINALNIYSSDIETPYICLNPDEDLADLMNLKKQLDKVKLSNIKSEFIDTLEDYSKIFFQIKFFELKFEPLFAWPYNYASFSHDEMSRYNTIFLEFFADQSEQMRTQYKNEFNELKEIFSFLCLRISRLKCLIKAMLDEFQAIGQLYLESSNLHLAPSKTEEGLQKRMVNTLTEVKIASKRKTDVIKILSAMYDSKMFVDTEKKTLTNKQKMMEAFGEFLGEDFSNYSSYLSQSKDKNPDVFIRTFDNLRATAKEYFNQ